MTRVFLNIGGCIVIIFDDGESLILYEKYSDVPPGLVREFIIHDRDGNLSEGDSAIPMCRAYGINGDIKIRWRPGSNYRDMYTGIKRVISCAQLS